MIEKLILQIIPKKISKKKFRLIGKRLLFEKYTGRCGCKDLQTYLVLCFWRACKELQNKNKETSACL